jgi:hypothetical protein
MDEQIHVAIVWGKGRNPGHCSTRSRCGCRCIRCSGARGIGGVRVIANVVTGEMTDAIETVRVLGRSDRVATAELELSRGVDGVKHVRSVGADDLGGLQHGKLFQNRVLAGAKVSALLGIGVLSWPNASLSRSSGARVGDHSNRWHRLLLCLLAHSQGHRCWPNRVRVRALIRLKQPSTSQGTSRHTSSSTRSIL